MMRKQARPKTTREPAGLDVGVLIRLVFAIAARAAQADALFMRICMIDGRSS